MASLLSKAKELRERIYPVLKESAFLERGVLTSFSAIGVFQKIHCSSAQPSVFFFFSSSSISFCALLHPQREHPVSSYERVYFQT